VLHFLPTRPPRIDRAPGLSAGFPACLHAPSGREVTFPAVARVGQIRAPDALLGHLAFLGAKRRRGAVSPPGEDAQKSTRVGVESGCHGTPSWVFGSKRTAPRRKAGDPDGVVRASGGSASGPDPRTDLPEASLLRPAKLPRGAFLRPLRRKDTRDPRGINQKMRERKDAALRSSGRSGDNQASRTREGSGGQAHSPRT
jgi:hypothetical protein